MCHHICLAKDGFLNHFHITLAVVYQPLSKFGVFTSLSFAYNMFLSILEFLVGEHRGGTIFRAGEGGIQIYVEISFFKRIQKNQSFELKHQFFFHLDIADGKNDFFVKTILC